MIAGIYFLGVCVICIMYRKQNGRAQSSLITVVTFGEELGKELGIVVEGNFSFKNKALILIIRKYSYIICIPIKTKTFHGSPLNMVGKMLHHLDPTVFIILFLPTPIPQPPHTYLPH